VPADYFKQPNVIVPATPPTPTKKAPRYVLFAGMGAAVLAVVGIFAFTAISNGGPAPRTADSARATSSATAAPPPSATAVVSAQPPPAKAKPVAITATPDIAVIYRDNQPVHQVPWSIEVEEGKTVTIEVRADGWEPKSLDLDGSEGSRVVKLVKRFVGGAKPSGAQPGTKPSDLVDPWKKKKGP
jgi:eukaryotic-like serine/threonine-protein kinase